MKTVNLVDAKTHLSELITVAAGGDTVSITRRGKPVARIVPPTKPRRPIMLDDLKALSMLSAGQLADTEETIRTLRDDARY